MRDSEIVLPDGRVLAYVEIGEPSWPCLFFFHGAPLSRLHLAYLGDRFEAERVRVIAPERPGYGRSSPRSGRTLMDWSADVGALADALGIERFLASGHSSGGPYAVSCAALLPDHVLGGIVLAGVTDMGWSGAWDGYSPMESALMRVADEQAAVDWCVGQFGTDGARFNEVADFQFAAPDHALFVDRRAGPALGGAVAEAFRQGIVGYAHDVFVQAQPWTFDPRRIAVPVEVLHGEVDTVVPLEHSRHTAELIPGATFTVVAGHAHMTLVHELPAIAARLARSIGRT
jgi:pimeloyl-ACP methyl ester carboxylesterase